eukprot:TRINITY_DN7194_c0_g1_i1.p1 TRINITY_DN7194_c0_g1~~TRINITY_DN7194_c0_g1_i1.p1  ORF type:complete len:139 (+),score=14.30 TRINITY_DN7194_c0_g1_i1:134-550(+)
MAATQDDEVVAQLMRLKSVKAGKPQTPSFGIVHPVFPNENEYQKKPVRPRPPRRGLSDLSQITPATVLPVIIEAKPAIRPRRLSDSSERLKATFESMVKKTGLNKRADCKIVKSTKPFTGKAIFRYVFPSADISKRSL